MALAGRLTAQVKWLGLRVSGRRLLSLYSSKLMNLVKSRNGCNHDDSITNNGSVTIIYFSTCFRQLDSGASRNTFEWKSKASGVGQ